MTDSHRTKRWRGAVAVALVAGGVGVVAMRPSLLLVAVVAIVFAVYPLVSPPPSPAVEVHRTVDDPSPSDGQDVRVTVTVRNAGDHLLPDLRVVDGVPPALAVTDGSPRLGTALRAGRTAEFAYTVEARAGRHQFAPATVVARDLSGGHEVETTAETDTELRCVTAVGDVALRDATTVAVGSVLTRRGGSGLEFHGTRQYRPGDELSRIDWSRFAKTGEHATVQYRQERAADVVVLVDAREAAYRGAGDGPHAVACCVSAAQHLVPALFDGRNRVGIAGLGRSVAWLQPGSGRHHRARARRLLESHEAFSYVPPAEEPDLDRQLDALARRLSDDTQLVVLSPLLDDEVRVALTRLEARGHHVSVVSPDVTGVHGATDGDGAGGASLGQRLAAVERRNAISALRAAGVPVTDWPPETPLATVLAVEARRRRVPA